MIYVEPDEIEPVICTSPQDKGLPFACLLRYHTALVSKVIVDPDALNNSTNLALQLSEGSATSEINKCIVWGYKQDGIGLPKNKIIYAQLNKTILKTDGNILIDSDERIPISVRGIDGYFEKALYNNEQMEGGAKWRFDFGAGEIKEVFVPNIETKNINLLQVV